MNLTNGLLTRGLGVDLPACRALITMHFHLFALEVVITPPPGGMGGSRPLAPGEFKNFYQPVDPSTFPGDVDQSMMGHPIFLGDLKDVKEIVAVKVTLNGRTIEKEFAVPIKRAKVIIKVANFINTTRERMHVVADNIKERKNKLIAKIYKIRSKK